MHHTSAVSQPQFMVLAETSTLALSVAEMSMAEMPRPKCPRLKCPWPKWPTFQEFKSP